jgi:hypothetical protein
MAPEPFDCAAAARYQHHGSFPNRLEGADHFQPVLIFLFLVYFVA